MNSWKPFRSESRWRRMRTLVALLAACLLGGCRNLAKIDVTVIDERTQLENQVLGVYEDISQDMVTLASVRGVDEEGAVRQPPPQSEGQKQAMLAMQNREFNRDDIEAFKRDGIAGESNRGLLSIIDEKKLEADPERARFVRTKIEEENRDRQILMQRVIEMTPGLSEQDLPSIQTIMAKRNRDSARPGEMVQSETGEWKAKGGGTGE